MADVEFVTDGAFGLSVPQSCGNVPASVLNPRDAWNDKDAYDATAEKLVGLFHDNFTKYANKVSASVLEQAIGKK